MKWKSTATAYVLTITSLLGFLGYGDSRTEAVGKPDQSRKPEPIEAASINQDTTQYDSQTTIEVGGKEWGESPRRYEVGVKFDGEVPAEFSYSADISTKAAIRKGDPAFNLILTVADDTVAIIKTDGSLPGIQVIPFEDQGIKGKIMFSDITNPAATPTPAQKPVKHKGLKG